MKFSALALTTAVLFTASFANAGVVVDLDSLSHGDVVRDQFAGTNNLLVRAENFNTPDGPLHNMAVIFDTTTNYLNGDGDGDLRAPWDGGNVDSDYVVGNILIIQERTPGNDDEGDDGIPETVDVPDDEGGRPAGTITLSWRDCLIDSLHFTLIDVEPDLEPFSVTFANEFSMSTIQILNGVDYGFGTTAFGNNHANRIGFSADDIGIGGWDTVTFNFGGSGGLGELDYTKIEIPAPAALPAGLLALAAVLARRRRN